MSRRHSPRVVLPCPTPWKALYGNQSVAVARINEINSTVNRHTKTPQRAYPCPCGFWHLTSKE